MGSASRPAATMARVVVAALAVVTAAALPAFLTGALAVQIGRDLDFSVAGLGIAVGAYFITSALGSALLGRLVERIGWRAGMYTGAGATFASCAGIAAFARSWSGLVVWLAVGGLGNAISQPAANLSLTRLVPAGRQGAVFGVKQSAIPVATLLGGLSVPALALTVGWRWTYVAAAVVALMAAASVVDAVDGSRVRRPPRSPAVVPALPVRPLFFVSAAGGLGAMVGNALGAFLVTTAVTAGVTESSAGLLLAAASVAGLSVRVGAGWSADVRPFRPLVAVGALLGLGAVGCIMIASLTPALLVFGALIGFAAAWGWPGLLNLAVVRDYPEAPAMATGISQTGVYIGAASGPILFGFVADHLGLDTAWVMTTVLAACAALASFVGERRLGVARRVA